MAGISEKKIRNLLKTKSIGRRIYVHDSVDSTNDEAKRNHCGADCNGTAVIAEYQSSGHGRRGKTWFSPKGEGICMSVVFQPKLPPEKLPPVTIAVGVAVSEAIKDVTGLSVELGYPNDLYVAKKKAGGILVESVCKPNGGTDETGPQSVAVIGIGVNVNTGLDSFPEKIRGKSTSLAWETGRRLDRNELVAAILNRLEEYLGIFLDGGLHKIVGRWKKNNITLGREVSIRRGENFITGTALDMDDSCALIVRRGDGEIERVVSGELALEG